MDFLQKATAKLDVQDKLPGQLKDMLGGDNKGKQDEGKHLAQTHDDAAGFPQGLRPSEYPSLHPNRTDHPTNRTCAAGWAIWSPKASFQQPQR